MHRVGTSKAENSDRELITRPEKCCPKNLLRNSALLRGYEVETTRAARLRNTTFFDEKLALDYVMYSYLITSH